MRKPWEGRPVVCIGGALVDELFHCQAPVVQGTSNPALLERQVGGVMCNVAHHLALLGVPVRMVTATGRDADGDWLLTSCRAVGIDMPDTLRVDAPTGRYTALIGPDGALFAAACADTCMDRLDAEWLAAHQQALSGASLLLADTNLPASTLAWLIAYAAGQGVPLIIEPVSVAKAAKLRTLDLQGLFMVTPNEDELPFLCGRDHPDGPSAVAELLARGAARVWLRKGKAGTDMVLPTGTHSRPAPQARVVDATGAGDAALAGWVAAWWNGGDEAACMSAADRLAGEVLMQKGAVARHITPDLLSAIPLITAE